MHELTPGRHPEWSRRADEIVRAGRFLFAQGWSPATSSNYSARLDEELVAITVSGRHKGHLQFSDVMTVDLHGNVHSTGRPSAETLLHCVIYSLFPNVGAVLHTHSVNATVLSRMPELAQGLELNGYELQKAFEGHTTHEETINVPVFENSQDIAALAEQSRNWLIENPQTPAYLIRGHGMYTWGSNMDVALRHVEAMEFLMQCEMQHLALNRR
ncbi:MAG: methylthioribulose 1-phosphate dehydratase [Chromatiales bacterium]|nr:methylthioribulose 1-phosphate dehydratase [Chromatiales bacterium]